MRRPDGYPLSTARRRQNLPQPPARPRHGGAGAGGRGSRHPRAAGQRPGRQVGGREVDPGPDRDGLRGARQRRGAVPRPPPVRRPASGLLPSQPDGVPESLPGREPGFFRAADHRRAAAHRRRRSPQG